mgnify:FL=1
MSQHAHSHHEHSHHSHPLPVWARLIAIGLLVLVAGRAVTLHVADYYVDLAKAGDENAHTRALDWNPNHPEALRIKGRRLLPKLNGTAREADVAASMDAFREAIAASPLEVRAMARLASTAALSDANPPEAKPLVDIADRLAPVMPQVQQQLVAASLVYRDAPGALIHMARAMVGNPGLQRAFFPSMLQLAATPEARDVLVNITNDPRPYSWWPAFFRHAAKTSPNLDALRGVVALRKNSSTWPLTADESEAFMERLRTEGLVTEAYLHWVNTLSKEQLGQLGYVFDGGFNLPFTNEPGFGWRTRVDRRNGFIVSRADGYGSSNDGSLRVTLAGKQTPFRHVYQDLALPSGRYRLTGRVRPDQLEGRKGMQWVIDCTAGGKQRLAESMPFLGTGEWREFSMTAEVPESCVGQRLTLQSAGSRAVDHNVSGTLWMDDLRLELLNDVLDP